MRISIHALLAESDWMPLPKSPKEDISIHALLAESDASSHYGIGPDGHFNPRSPCGERRADVLPNTFRVKFQSTLSLRRATEWICPNCGTKHDFNPRSPCGERQVTSHGHRSVRHISIHALLAESDLDSQTLLFVAKDFNPRSPCGERPPSLVIHTSPARDFNPRSPCGERH